MELLNNMVDTEGWVLVVKFINKRIEDNKNQLLTCDVEEVIRHRSKIEAYKSVLQFTKDTIEEGMIAYKQPP